MNALLFWRELRNRIDFGLRSCLRWDGPCRSRATTTSLPAELAEFIDRFAWDEWMPKYFSAHSSLTVADIGAKDFFLASLLSRRFSWRGNPPRVVGIELDGYRRYRDFTTRAAMGKRNAAQIPRGEYRVMNFLEWRLPLDVAICFSPFVTEEPLVRWGLPRTHFRPRDLFVHMARVLRPNGLLLLSCPTEREYELAKQLASDAGMQLLERREWKPSSSSSERSPRFGALFARS